ncbi:MAG: 4-oxalocrotonate tautomerase DmpI [Planctomycetota bacterium]|jgi:4-oxalocrotonate tautomerase
MPSQKLRGEVIMPLVIFEGPKMPAEMKRALAKSVTEAVSEATGHPKEIITMLIHENDPENVAPGGELLADRKGRESGD